MPPFPVIVGSAPAVVPALCSLSPGDSCYLFGIAPANQGAGYALDDTNVAAETILAGVASASVAMAIKGSVSPPMLCIEVKFSAAPGTFEIDIQEADTNSDDAFILPTSATYTINSVSATTQRARIDLSPTGGRFVRAFIKTLTNAVKTTIKVTRLA